LLITLLTIELQFIKSITDTYLKKQPIDSSQLGHNYSAGTWYLYPDHWHLSWEKSSQDNVRSSVSAPESSQRQGVNFVTRQQKAHKGS
jgi:hypothetical protein